MKGFISPERAARQRGSCGGQRCGPFTRFGRPILLRRRLAIRAPRATMALSTLSSRHGGIQRCSHQTSGSLSDSNSAANGGDAFGGRGRSHWRALSSFALLDTLSVIPQGPCEVRIAAGQLLVGTLLRRGPPRPRRRAPPTNWSIMHVFARADLVLPHTHVVHVHGHGGRREVRQVQPRRRSQPNRHWLIIPCRCFVLLARDRVSSSRSAAQGNGSSAVAGRAGARLGPSPAGAAARGRRGARGRSA